MLKFQKPAHSVAGFFIFIDLQIQYYEKSALTVLFTLILCSCSKKEEILSEETDTDLYHRIQAKYSITVAGFDRDFL